MSSINFATKEISVKIVFYGPGLCGKTTTLQSIYQSIKPDKRPQMVSLATDVDRTIFFDFLPVNAYKIGEFIVRLQLYTVPGQVFYNSTRKLVLNGVDGVVFVADSQPDALDDNRESFINLAENLKELGMPWGRVPYVLQYNKRDIPTVLSIDELNAALNQNNVPYFQTVALTGEGVPDVLKGISRLVISDLTSKGVGKKVLQKSESDWPKKGEASAPSTLEAALQESPRPETLATVTQTRTTLRTTSPSTSSREVAPASFSFASLWNDSAQRARCHDVESAIYASNYPAAVLAAWLLCAETCLGLAHADDGRVNAETLQAVSIEMTLRGFAGPQFLRFRDIVRRARAGEPMTLNEALFALHAAVSTMA